MRTPTLARLAVFVLMGIVSSSAAKGDIRCGGPDGIRGTLTYACAKINYPALAQIYPVFTGRGMAIQIWMRSVDPGVTGFIATVTYEDGSTVRKIELRNPVMITGTNDHQWTIIEFDAGPVAIQIEELRSVSATDW